MAGSVPSMRSQVETYIKDLQERIVGAFETLDPKAPAFIRDSWIRAQGGSGQSCVLPTSDRATERVLEKAGVNISLVHGMLPKKALLIMKSDHSDIPIPEGENEGLPFFAGGLSLVIHPSNPMAPTVHMNVRYFEVTAKGDDQSVLSWWFGGGTDLTPSYLFGEDAIHFHQTLKDACDAHSELYYPAFKKWCDEYFYIPHRGEARGIGGIFFDDLSHSKHPKLNETNAHRTPESIFAFVRSLGDALVPSYLPILSRRYTLPFTPANRNWQLLRRGRYVEFNLVYDRGTKFGLQTPGARIESVLMSLPAEARWEYMSEHGTIEGSEEEKIMQVLKKPREWLGTGK